MGLIFSRLLRILTGSGHENMNANYEENDVEEYGNDTEEVNIRVSNWILAHLPNFQNCEMVHEANELIYNNMEEICIENREEMLSEDRNINVERRQSMSNEFETMNYNEEREDYNINEGLETSEQNETDYADALESNIVDIELNEIVMEENTAPNFEEEATTSQIITRSKMCGKPGGKLQKKEPTHPPTSVMIIDSIKAQKKLNGATMEHIEQYMEDNYDININRLRHHIRNFTEKAVASGVLDKVQRDGCDAFIIKQTATSSMKKEEMNVTSRMKNEDTKKSQKKEK